MRTQPRSSPTSLQRRAIASRRRAQVSARTRSTEEPSRRDGNAEQGQRPRLWHEDLPTDFAPTEGARVEVQVPEPRQQIDLLYIVDDRVADDGWAGDANPDPDATAFPEAEANSPPRSALRCSGVGCGSVALPAKAERSDRAQQDPERQPPAGRGGRDLLEQHLDPIERELPSHQIG